MEIDHALTDWELDELFVKEVASVTKIVDKLPTQDKIIPMCLRWFEVLHQACPEEKFERNYILVILHQQLNDYKTLKRPFSDARNLQKDLITLLKISKAYQEGNGSVGDDVYETACSLQGCSSDDINLSGLVNSSSLKDVNQQLMDENAMLISELQSLQSEKEIIQERLQGYQANLDMLRSNDDMYKKEISYMKNIFNHTAMKALNLVDEALPTDRVPPMYFSTLLNVLGEHSQDRWQLGQLDSQLWRLMRKAIKSRLRNSVVDIVSRNYDVMRDTVRDRYREVSQNQRDSYMKDLVLKTMQYLKLLCQIFLDTYTGDKREMEAVEDFLQHHYNVVAQQL